MGERGGSVGGAWGNTGCVPGSKAIDTVWFRGECTRPGQKTSKVNIGVEKPNKNQRAKVNTRVKEPSW